MEYRDPSIAEEGDNSDNRKVKGDGYGPNVNAKIKTSTGEDITLPHEKVWVGSITQANLTNNIYTVPGEPATKIDGLRNNGPGNMTVTVANSGGNIVKTLKPGDVWDRDGANFTSLTFSAGAEFEADILR